ncbi:MAG: hypothetical protein JWM54_578 [Acidobacteriaceae bacterium]|nr:hypothetical protein [Acidobacteriaceae bacterium]
MTLSLATAFPVSALLVAAAQDQDHHDQDRDRDRTRANYTNNNYYQTGNREGYEDYQKKVRRKEHNHKYRSDEDRRAHDQGYEQGWQGHRDHDDPH